MTYPDENHFLKSYQFCDEYKISNADCQLIIEKIETIIGTKICWNLSQSNILKFRLRKLFQFHFFNIMDLREWKREAQSMIGWDRESNPSSSSTRTAQDISQEVLEIGNLLISGIRENQFEFMTQNLLIERLSPYDDLLHPKFLSKLPMIPETESSMELGSAERSSCEISLTDPTTPYPLFSRQYSLAKAALNVRERFETAEPWPHVIQDNLFHPQLLHCVAQEIQTLDDQSSPLWNRFNDRNQFKSGLQAVRLMGPLVS
jgi:hypothetical protein